DIRDAEILVGGRIGEPVEQDGLAVGRPAVCAADNQSVECRANVPVAVRELARRAAVGSNNEEVREAWVRVTATIGTVVQPVSDARSRRPLRVRRRSWEVDLPLD